MDRSEALAQVARLVSAFPGSRVADSSAALYAVELARHDHRDVVEAVDEVIRGSGRAFLPTLPELLVEVRAAIARRLDAERLARPRLPQGSSASPEEVHGIFQDWRRRLRARRRAEVAEASGG